jgi:hypothetical protein
MKKINLKNGQIKEFIPLTKNIERHICKGGKLIAIKAIRNSAFSSLKIGSFDAEVFSLT